MLTTYPAIFYYESDSYFVHFPDFKHSATQGDDVREALYMASDWLGMNCAIIIEEGGQLPKPSEINQLCPVENNPFKDDEDFEYEFDPEKTFVSMVYVDVSEYVENAKPVKKTLTIPSWANNLGLRHGINFSKLLTDAIVNATRAKKKL